MVAPCLLADVGALRSVEVGVTLPIVVLIVVEIPVNVITSTRPAGLRLHQGIELVMTIAHITVNVHARRLADTVLAHVLLNRWKNYLEEILEKSRKFRPSLQTNLIGQTPNYQTSKCYAQLTSVSLFKTFHLVG